MPVAEGQQEGAPNGAQLITMAVSIVRSSINDDVDLGCSRDPDINDPFPGIVDLPHGVAERSLPEGKTEPP